MTEKKLPNFQLVDGGYITWVYGQTQWGQMAWPPPFLKDTIIMMDSKEKTIREEQSPGYKGERKEKRKGDPYLYESWKRVATFRETIKDDPRVDLVNVPGLEADDLLVLAAWKAKKKPNLLGVDKDLLQAGRYIRMYDYHGERITRTRFQRRLAKTLQSRKLLSSHIPMVLAILGDKSDSVPRLLPPRELWLLWRMLWDDVYPDWDAAYKEFGRSLLHNLSLIILPHPSCMGLNPKDTFEIVRNREWGPKLLSQLRPYLVKEMKTWEL